MDDLCTLLNLNVDKDNKYNSILKELKVLARNKEVEIKLPHDFRNTIEVFLYEVNIPKIKKKIGNFNHVLSTGHSITKETDIPELELSILSDNSLILFLVKFLDSINYIQKDNLLLVKYAKNNWDYDWNYLNSACRGKIINIETKEIVSYPLDKFFNLNEGAETSIERIEEIIKNHKSVTVMDKADGSTISISKYNGELIITTNGDWDNVQINMAKALLEEKYKHFLTNLKENHTYIFELIHPNNKIVVSYGEEQKLILLAVRDLKTEELLTYGQCQEVAQELKLELIECFEFTSMEDFIMLSKTLTDSNREGWVFRVVTDEEDIMFKLKLDEYCKLHKLLMQKVSPYVIYELMKEEKLDDVIAKASEETKILINDGVLKVHSFLTAIETSLRTSLDLIQSKYDITPEEYLSAKCNRNHPKFLTRIELIKYAKSIGKDYLNYSGVMAYYEYNKSIEEFISEIDTITFRQVGRKTQFFNK